MKRKGKECSDQDKAGELKFRQTRLDETKVLRDSHGKRYTLPQRFRNLFERMVGPRENKQGILIVFIM